MGCTGFRNLQVFSSVLACYAWDATARGLGFLNHVDSLDTIVIITHPGWIEGPVCCSVFSSSTAVPCLFISFRFLCTYINDEKLYGLQCSVPLSISTPGKTFEGFLQPFCSPQILPPVKKSASKTQVHSPPTVRVFQLRTNRECLWKSMQWYQH